MDKINQLRDQFNNLSNLKKIAILAIATFLGLILLLMILSAFIPKPTPRKVLPPIPVFNPSPSPIISTSSARLVPQTSPFQGISVSYGTIRDNFIYYLSDGATTFYKASFDGRDKKLLTEPLAAQIKQVIWSNDRSSAILKIENNKYFLGKNNSPFFSEEDDNLATTNWYYHFSNQSYKKLDSLIEPIAFSPTDNLIAYIKKDSGGNLNKLYTASADGSAEQFIISLEEPTQNNLVFLDKDNILTFAYPDGYGKNFVYLTNLVSKTSQKLTDDGFTFGANPSPKGNFVLAQTAREDPEVFYKKFLSVVEVSTKKLTVLDIQTNPELAAWSSNGTSVYIFESGKLWLLNVTNLTKQQIELSSEFQNLKVDEGSILLSADNNNLFFTSEGKLYSLKLN